MSKAGKKIIEGLEDAIAYVKGDQTRGFTMKPNPICKPADGIHAFPDGCPACRAPVTDYCPEDDEEWAVWTFRCGARIFLRADRGNFEADDECPFVMDEALKAVRIET